MPVPDPHPPDVRPRPPVVRHGDLRDFRVVKVGVGEEGGGGGEPQGNVRTENLLWKERIKNGQG